MQPRIKYLIIISLVVVGLGIAALLLNQTVRTESYVLAEPPVWRDITVGETDAEAALRVLGEPTEVITRDNAYMGHPEIVFQIYRYEDRRDLAWKWVEVWTQKEGDVEKVVGISLDSPYRDVTLREVVAYYRKPEKVSWGVLSHERCLVWAHRGVTFNASSRVRDRLMWSQMRVRAMILTPPMPLQQFEATEWPWFGNNFTGCSGVNMSPRDARDTAPEDPYDWSDLPPFENIEPGSILYVRGE